MKVLQFSVDNARSRRHHLAQRGDTLDIVNARIISREKSSQDAAMDLSSGLVRHPVAQAILAHKVMTEGIVEDAVRLLQNDHVNSGEARMHLLRKIVCNRHGDNAYYLFSLKKEMDKEIRVSLEECMRGFSDDARLKSLLEKRMIIVAIVNDLIKLLGQETMEKLGLV